MKKKSFSISEAVGFGWNTVKKNLLLFVGLQIISVLIDYAPSILKSSISKDQGALISLISLASWVLQIGVSLGFLYIVLKFVDGEKAEFSDLFSQFKPRLLLNYFLAGLIGALITIGGFLLFIIPGMIVAIRYSLSGFVLVDKNTGPLQSLSTSWKITKGNFWKLCLFGLTLIGINLLGLLALVVGLLVTMPLSMLAVAYAYRKLS
ncbi:MAG: DUF975 family protein [bacterium]|nr:DUF975 family protein [bacterium]